MYECDSPLQPVCRGWGWGICPKFNVVLVEGKGSASAKLPSDCLKTLGVRRSFRVNEILHLSAEAVNQAARGDQLDGWFVGLIRSVANGAQQTKPADGNNFLPVGMRC